MLFTLNLCFFLQYIHTDVILGLDDLDDVFEKVQEVKNKWKPLGRNLLTATLRHELKSIESEHRSDDERLYAMLKVWLTKTDTLQPSWRSLKKALKEIGREDLAHNIDGTIGEPYVSHSKHGTAYYCNSIILYVPRVFAICAISKLHCAVCESLQLQSCTLDTRASPPLNQVGSWVVL